ncbi:flavin reductase [Streptosporangium sp. NPDC051022]|uniref:flavin reductase n=1 Tax=Streptosporangium sp. NPDC051022 TaxID=3155752 RepID=UPI00342225FD
MRPSGVEQVQLKTPLDQGTFRQVIGHFASGVTVITTREGERLFGSTASAVSSLSLEPPMLLVCLNQSSETAKAIQRTGRFVVNVLEEGQGDLAVHFAGKGDDKFLSVRHSPGVDGQPLLDGSLAHLECSVADVPTGGTHVIFLGHVVNAVATPGAPLAYYQGRFGAFVEMSDRSAHQRLRAMVLERELPLDCDLTVDDVAERLQANPLSAYYAITRLLQEGLLQHSGPGAYQLVPVDGALVSKALDARATLTLGVIADVLDSVSHEDLARVHEAAERASVELHPDQDAEERRASIVAFHETLLSLSGNPMVLDTYHLLSVPSILAQVVSGTDWGDLHRRWSQARVRFAETLARRDLPAAREAVMGYSDDLKMRCLELIGSRGGRI